MTDDDNSTTTVDGRRMASLAGAWRAAVCVGPDGTETFWLLSPNPQGAPGCACATCAAHDQLTQDHRRDRR